MASSASSSSRRKHIMQPGPITINIADGTPFGPYYHSFITRISSHVTHSDEFPPSQTWPQHKKAGRVEALYRDLTAAYSLPSWNDSSDMAARFRQWFNESARHKWNDHKNRSLRRTYDLCKGDVTQASSHQPSTVDADTWTSLLSTYSQNHTVDESGFSKSAKCKASRTCNELDHRLGRESLGSWKGKFRRDRGREPRAVEIFNKEFTKQDPLLASEGNLPPPHMRGKPVSERTFEIGNQRRLLHVMEPRRRYSFRVFCLLISLTFSDARYTRQTKEHYLQTFKHTRKTPTNPPYCIYHPPHTPTPPKAPPGTPILQPPVVYQPPSAPPPPVHGGTMPGLWCVAKPTVPDPIIQEAMDYACGAGAECESVQPGRSCYHPNTLLAHASFAFNSYWQRTKVAGGTCDFEGTAILITIDPSYGGCNFDII